MGFFSFWRFSRSSGGSPIETASHWESPAQRRIATGGGELTIDDTNDDRPGLISGFLVQAINPKAWIVSLSAIATFVAPQQAYVERLTIFAGLFFVICAASLTGWATVGHAAARLSGNVKAFNIVMATLLTISIGLILASEVINH